ncbi:MAG TPA: tRNA preQ1(34) S-adenosylmethionine ribosyltransferase-isomerase QueA [Candidatus Baltobacteraceae bacterium]|nr:tRNA preQ1(34) S-adenosylmethionine ribosyltransferase-isomerase QueA [Candidatus Baltobacteraceae bacterium]
MTTDERLTAAYDYDLPQELIAQHPAAQRDASRLMVLEGGATQHRRFSDLPALLKSGDLLVLNETRVIRARLLARRAGGGSAELLLLHPARSMRYDASALRWIALTRPARRLRPGARVTFDGLGEAVIVAELAEGMREVELRLRVPFEEFLQAAGRMPLPPYIHNESAEAQERYQTVFARAPGSVAAPTASLHFTPELLEVLKAGGVEIARLSLDVGLGTFRPVNAESVNEHVMHAEAYAISSVAASAIERARRAGRRIVAAGTTVVRALEGNLQAFGRIEAGEHETDCFISPGFTFGVVNAMITNFHLPRSTLLMMVSAFAGRERILHAYAEAIAHGYRFYSFGDAMLILWECHHPEPVEG